MYDLRALYPSQLCDCIKPREEPDGLLDMVSLQIPPDGLNVPVVPPRTYVGPSECAIAWGCTQESLSAPHTPPKSMTSLNNSNVYMVIYMCC